VRTPCGRLLRNVWSCHRGADSNGAERPEMLAEPSEDAAAQTRKRVAGEPNQRPARVAVRPRRASRPQKASWARRPRSPAPLARGGHAEHQAASRRFRPHTACSIGQSRREPPERLRSTAASRRTQQRPSPLALRQVHSTGRAAPASRRTRRRLTRYRVGAEGRTSHVQTRIQSLRKPTRRCHRSRAW
jgi:hypothetical protein